MWGFFQPPPRREPPVAETPVDAAVDAGLPAVDTTVRLKKLWFQRSG